ncbi:peptidase S15 [Teratosphaeria destructans]|uniref:Peptidase S15 n=1 Tax=Teratosphaeria destructans TaxID=418781 RepID=A0A9W7SJC9_9PEZI|nr:peptidase S15 [Teratosphaeria destructans]
MSRLSQRVGAKPALREDIEFMALTGERLRGWLFPAAKRGPALIIGSGVREIPHSVSLSVPQDCNNSRTVVPKELMTPVFAELYYEQGFTVLMFDGFSLGASEGEPRNHCTIERRIQDLTDAVTFLSQHPSVDDKKIALWGICSDATIMIAAAATDRRIGAVVAMAPPLNLGGKPERREPILELAMADRLDQMAGKEPMYLPVINEDGMSPIGYELGLATLSFAEAAGVIFDNRMTVRSLVSLLSWDVRHLLPKVSPAAVLICTPELDEVVPMSDSRTLYDTLEEPKEFCIIPGRKHFDWLFDETRGQFQTQVDFLKQHLKL